MPSGEACEITSVYPSAGALAARSEPIVPPAPGLFSTTTCVPSAAESFGARMREMVSAVPPGGKVAIRRMAPLAGQPGLARPALGTAGTARVEAAAARTVRRVIFTASAPIFDGLPVAAAMHMPALRNWQTKRAEGRCGGRSWD